MYKVEVLSVALSMIRLSLCFHELHYLIAPFCGDALGLGEWICAGNRNRGPGYSRDDS